MAAKVVQRPQNVVSSLFSIFLFSLIIRNGHRGLSIYIIQYTLYILYSLSLSAASMALWLSLSLKFPKLYLKPTLT